MTPLDTLAPDQRAVLELVLRQGGAGYLEILAAGGVPIGRGVVEGWQCEGRGDVLVEDTAVRIRQRHVQAAERADRGQHLREVSVDRLHGRSGSDGSPSGSLVAANSASQRRNSGPRSERSHAN